MHKQDAIAYFGGVRKLAEVLGISTAAVYQWPDEVPRLRALELEMVTGGALQADPPPAA